MVVNKNNWSDFVTKLFENTNWYYLSVIFNGKGYKVGLILWKDEIDKLQRELDEMGGGSIEEWL